MYIRSDIVFYHDFFMGLMDNIYRIGNLEYNHFCLFWGKTEKSVINSIEIGLPDTKLYKYIYVYIDLIFFRLSI